MAELTAIRYADSLFEVALENNAQNEVLKELFEVRDIFKQNPDLPKALENPVVTNEEKQNALDAVFGGRICKYTLNFLKLITEKRHINDYYQMCEKYKLAYNGHFGIEDVELTTAKPLSPRLEEKLKAKLEQITGKKVVLKAKVDPDILGGIVVKLANKQLDASIKTKLESLKAEIGAVIA